MVMKKITFRADAGKLELARRIAEAKGTTLEEEVRQWLKDLGEGRWKLTPRGRRKGRPAGPRTIEEAAERLGEVGRAYLGR
jgi:hypothetical protein